MPSETFSDGIYLKSKLLKGSVRQFGRFRFCFHRVQMSCLLLRRHRAQRY
ncbi:hypothetical protein NEIPOLOT_02559 [Neisseria polysaccharea ATCC 43768]|nr:hypothetical protein NEIPOLOT_02559 [Neisseria polysaccharea ATCC 43768]